jgi:hypothetical protein
VRVKFLFENVCALIRIGVRKQQQRRLQKFKRDCGKYIVWLLNSDEESRCRR